MVTDKRVIVCGGIKPKGVNWDAEGVVCLDLWGKHSKANVELHIEDIHARLLREVPEAFRDLVEIATYVYCADQAVGRGAKDVDTFGAKWRRDFDFHIPVRCPELWDSDEVKRILCETVGFLSDDFYEFCFYPAQNPPAFQQYLGLEEDGPHGVPEQIIMFSGGLDSLGGAIKEAIVERRRILLVNHRPTQKLLGKHGELMSGFAKKAGAFTPDHLKIRIHKDRHLTKEYTQRSRSFLYAALGATVAYMVDLKSVRFYENGTVALNLPVCAQVVGGRATRTAHPRVLDGFQRLISLVAGEAFTFVNPFIWTTRGEAIKGIVSAGCGGLIAPSTSCAHVWEITKEQTHCGACSQCIDRRFGVIAAGAEGFDPVSQYRMDMFTESLPKDIDKTMVATYLERANSVKAIGSEAQLVTRFPEVLDILPYLNGNTTSTAARVLDLYRRHAAEVNTAVDTMMGRHLTAIRERRLPGDSLLRIVYESNSPISLPAPVGASESSDAGSVTASDGVAKYVFQQSGQVWEVVCEGNPPFHIQNTLGARYLDWLLHHPSEAISAFDLEKAVTPEKAAARQKDAKAYGIDGDAIREYLRTLNDLRAKREEAQAEGGNAEAVRLDGEIAAIEAELKKQGRSNADTGERARNNVRKAIGSVKNRLAKGKKYEKAFLKHIEDLVDTGYRCQYKQPKESVWD